jgi:hypothetical protein
MFEDENADLYFRIFQEGVLVTSTEDSVLWNVKEEQADIQINRDLSVGRYLG